VLKWRFLGIPLSHLNADEGSGEASYRKYISGASEPDSIDRVKSTNPLTYRLIFISMELILNVFSRA